MGKRSSARSPTRKCGPLLRSAELFDPVTRTFSPAGTLGLPVYDAAAAQLADGRVLLAGGYGDGAMCQLWSPRTGAFMRGPNMHVARVRPALTTLADGQVVAIGSDAKGTYEIYDPARNRWSPPQPLPEPWYPVSARLMPDGRVLVTLLWQTCCCVRDRRCAAQRPP